MLWLATIAAWYWIDPSYEPINVLVSAVISTLLSLLSWLQTRKSEIKGHTVNPVANIADSPVNGVVVAGSSNVTVTNSPNQLNYLLVTANSPEQRAAYFEQIIGVDQGRYDREQYQAYCTVWKTLQGLKLAGDALWQKTDEQNLSRFLQELLKVRNQVHEYAIFLDDRHYRSLTSILEQFDAYALGKREVAEIYAAGQGRQNMPSWSPEVRERVAKRIDENRQFKYAYEELLDKILRSFRRKLAGSRTRATR